MTQKTKSSLRRRTLLAAALAAMGVACAAPAFADPDLVDFKVVDRDTGRPLRVWRHHGRFYVAGEPGARYSLRVTNHTGGRVLVVMSVDGINIMSGETAGYDQRGYVFAPYETYDVTGWRKSQNEVAAFNFAALPQSYAARTGRPADVGVIGIAAFREKVEIAAAEAPERRPAWRRAYDRSPPIPAVPAPAPPPPSMIAAPAARAASPSSSVDEVAVTGSRLAKSSDKLGTAHGAREESHINIVSFERATSRPQQVSQIEYDTYDNLVAAGVIHTPSEPPHRPHPFPPRAGEGYVPDPPYEP